MDLKAAGNLENKEDLKDLPKDIKPTHHLPRKLKLSTERV